MNGRSGGGLSESHTKKQALRLSFAPARERSLERMSERQSNKEDKRLYPPVTGGKNATSSPSLSLQSPSTTA